MNKKYPARLVRQRRTTYGADQPTVCGNGVSDSFDAPAFQCYTLGVMGQDVLVLNQNYEPLNVCHTHRAVILLISGKAEIVSDGRGYISTPTARFPRPSVIRLAHQVHRPRPKLKLTRRAVFRRDNFTCQYCGVQSHHLTIDHIIPRSRGGPHVWSNVASACPQCNRRKGGKTLSDARMALKAPASEPSGSMRMLFAHYLEEYQDWEPFLK